MAETQKAQKATAAKATTADVTQTQADKDAAEAVERSRTDQDAAREASGGEPTPIVNDQNTGPTAEEAEADAAEGGHITGERPRTTRAEGEIPGTLGHTAAGDAPADTMDPRERVTTATPSGSELAAAARDGLGSVVAYAKVGELGAGEDRDAGDRYEEYEVPVSPLTGETVRVRRNMETGLSVRVEGEANQGPLA